MIKTSDPMRFKSFYPIRFYPVLDTAVAKRHGWEVVPAAAAILEGGARILQFRHKGFVSREVFEQAKEIAALCEQAGALFVMNDRADLAKLLGAALHLGQDDLTVADSRRVMGDEAVIGLSTHNESQLRAAEATEYLAIGPIFGTTTKQNPDPVVGLKELRRLRTLTDRPLVAIGGITRANGASVLEAGANAVAVIGDLFPDIRASVEDWMKI